MTIEQIMNERASCRSFSDQSVSDELVEKLVNIACKAPSGGGFQNYSIIKIRNAETKHKLAQLCRNQSFFEKAPVCLLFCIDYRRIKRINQSIPAPMGMQDQFMDLWMSVLDTAICAQTLCLAAEEENLKTVYIGNIIHTMDQVAKLLKLPSLVCPSILVVLGYPSHPSKPSKKYDATVLMHEEEYQDMEMDDLLVAYEKKYEDWKMRPTEMLLKKIYDTCFRLHGQAFAEQFLHYAAEHHQISPYQFWFGSYYLPQKDFLDGEGYKIFMKHQGFHWLK